MAESSLDNKMRKVVIACWVIGIIPGLNDVADIVYLFIYWIVYVPRRGMKLLNPKVIFVFVICFLLNLIPVVCWIPWMYFGNKYINKITNGPAKKSVKPVKKQVQQGQPLPPIQTQPNEAERHMRMSPSAYRTNVGDRPSEGVSTNFQDIIPPRTRSLPQDEGEDFRKAA